MIRINDIAEGLASLVGWRQERNPEKRIDPSLTTSESGLYFQEAHPLLTIDNMRSVMPEDWEYGYPEWTSTTEADKVRYGGKVWSIPEGGDKAVAPGTNDSEWTVYDVVNDYLAQVSRAGLVKTIQHFISTKVNAKEMRNLLEHRTLFDGAGRFNDVVPNKGAIVGFEITPLRQVGITMVLERIGLQMRSALGEVTLYLFHSSKSEPVAVWKVNFNKQGGDFEWLSFSPQDFAMAGDWDSATKKGIMPYLNPGNDGGSYYLVYHQSELPKWMDAINYARDWSKEPCMSCNRGNVQEWRELTKYVRLSPFMVHDDEFLETHRLWDLADMVYTPSTNYGINFQYSIGCDITDFIIQQKMVFANAYQLQTAYTALKGMVDNPDVRVNRNQVNASALLYDLDGEAQGRPTGLLADLNKAYKALEIDTQGIAKVCLGCSNKGVIYGSM